MPPRPGRVPVWWLRSERDATDPAAGGRTVVVHAVATDERPDRSVVDVRDLPPGRAASAGRLARLEMRADTLQLLRVEPLGEAAQGAPRLVLLERVLRDAPVRAELMAFRHDDVARRAEALGVEVRAGTVLTAADAARLGLVSADQVGAVGWRAGTGEVLEIYVDPAHRRRRVATLLLVAAEGTAAARGWPRLWGGGVRTALGETMLARLRWGVGRLAPLTAVAPPMTPGEAGAVDRAQDRTASG